MRRQRRNTKLAIAEHAAPAAEAAPRHGAKCRRTRDCSRAPRRDQRPA